MEDSDWRDVIDNNLNGTANTIRAFAPKMVAKKKGRIIVLSSMQGKHGTKDAASYSASKWGILGLMKSAAMELGQYEITVNARHSRPRRHRAHPLRKAPVAKASAKPGRRSKARRRKQAWDNRAPTVPMRVGWLQPDDISPVAVFLASDAAALVTGAEYEVTGGRQRQRHLTTFTLRAVLTSGHAVELRHGEAPWAAGDLHPDMASNSSAMAAVMGDSFRII